MKMYTSGGYIICISHVSSVGVIGLRASVLFYSYLYAFLTDARQCAATETAVSLNETSRRQSFYGITNTAS